MNYTSEQEKCVTSLIGPLDVSAGAGSGKTFTLTQRIAHALSDPGSGVDEIDQVMAITFTRKAAAELKGRVRSVLRANGMFDQARRVDGAWISTIHGMCSRILRASALELGIDPAFSVLEDSHEVLAQAIDEVLDECRSPNAAGAYAEYQELLATFPPRTEGFGTSLSGLLETVLNAVHGLPGGFDDLHIVASSASPSELARLLLDNYEGCMVLLEAMKESKTQEANIVAAQAAIEALNRYLCSGLGEVGALLEALNCCKRLDTRCGSAEQKEVLKEYNTTHTQLVREAALLQSGALLQQLLQLAHRVEQVFAQKKRALSVLDNNDLIKCTLEALDNPAIAALYSDRFRLVMVDEFQDTDALQLAIIKRLTGPGQRYLCTVGDAQQSIYGFRGADVAVYRAYQQHLFAPEIAEAGGQPQELLLTRNFRSHADVLSFVRAICSQPRVFGQQFLDLQAVYDGCGYRASGPRIRVEVTSVPDGKVAEVGGIGDTVPEQAKRIVEYFGEMRDAGHSLSDMVLLLGVTTHAQEYAAHLRAAGFECVISGGSLFAQSDEARMSVMLARALANPKDTEALYNVLAGSLFNVSADELLQLATSFLGDTDCLITRSLDRGVYALGAAAQDEVAALRQAMPAALRAQQVLHQAWKSLSFEPLSVAVRYVLRESGCLARLEARGAEGTASLANYFKALRLMEKIEQQGCVGVAQVAKAFANKLEGGLKEAPGALNAAGEQAIRIMSIHASKGLEFPIVAMADFAKTPRPAKLLVQRVEGQTYIALLPVVDKIANVNCGSSDVAAMVSDDCDVTRQALSAASIGEACALLLRASQADGAAEEQRLFYVGATRAKEAMGLFVNMKESAKTPLSAYKGVYADVAAGLFPDGLIPEGESLVDYGGSAPARVCKRLLDVRESGDAGDGVSQQTATVQPRSILHERQPWELLPAGLPEQRPTGLVSYSSLARENDVVDLLANLVLSDDETLSFRRSSSTLCRGADADKATDFGLALHRLCQLSMLRDGDFARERMNSVADTYRVRQRERLATAFERWEKSRVFARARRADARFPELPFSVQLGTEGIVLEGAFDLLCVTGDRALVVDYKTGGYAEESAEDLQKKHGLQACCYAYAVLSQGYSHVDLIFVRVEQDDPVAEDSLQSVCYSFTQQQLGELERFILTSASADVRS